MILTWRSGLLATLLVFIFVLLQNTFFSQLEVLGASVWMLPVVAVVFGLLGGSLIGATVGFGTGFLADGLGDSPLGVSCLVLMAVGYLGGYYRERSGRADQFSVLGLSAAAVLAANLAFGLFGLLVGFTAPLGWGVIPDMLLQTLYGAFLALPVYALIYRVLRPALILEAAVPRRPKRASAVPAVLGSDDEV